MYTKPVFKFVVAAAGLGYVAAQLSGLSSQCQSTLTSIVVSPSSSCLNAQALVGLVAAPANTSLIGPINNWLTGLCGQPACSNDTLTTIVTNLTNGCQADLQSIGAGSINAQEATNIVLSAYPAVRQIACLTDSNNGNGLCVTETLTAIQNSTGTTLSASGVQTLLAQIMAGQLPNLPPSVICTDCTKAAFNIVNKEFPGLVDGGVNVAGNVSSVCGADFVNGATPSTVAQSANNGTASPDGSHNFAVTASPISLAGVFISSLIALGSGIAVLA